MKRNNLRDLNVYKYHHINHVHQEEKGTSVEMQERRVRVEHEHH